MTIDWAVLAVYAAAGVVFVVAGWTVNGAILIALCVGFMLWLALGPRRVTGTQIDRLCLPTRLVLADTHFTIETDLERSEGKWALVRKIRQAREAFG